MEKIDSHNRCHQESLDIKKLGTKDWSKRLNLSVFAMNVVDIWLAYQCTTRTAYTKADFYNYLAEEIIDNIYNRFMIQSEDGRRRTIVDSDDETVDDDNPLFGWNNGAPRCGIAIHVTPLRRGERRGMGHILNTCFKASERSSGRRQHMCVHIVLTQMRSKMKCGSTNLRKTVPVLHSMCISHMTFSKKYIIIK